MNLRNLRALAPPRVPLALLALAALAAGCSPTYTYTFQVSIRNETHDPITVWLTKDSGPVENNWISPEQLATRPFDSSTPIPARIIPPGKIGTTPPITGHFPEGGAAEVRVYRNALETLPQILAVPPPKTPNRTDIILAHDGRSDYIIRDKDGYLVASPAP